MELVLVLEIGYSQSMASLRKKAQRWLSETSAREVILIDIGPRAERLVGEIWRRDAVQNPVQEVGIQRSYPDLITFRKIARSWLLRDRNICVSLYRICMETDQKGSLKFFETNFRILKSRLISISCNKRSCAAVKLPLNSCQM